MAQAGTFGQRVRQQLHLRDAPPSLITRSRRGIELAVTETRDDSPMPGRSGSVADEAYIVSLKLHNYPDCELWDHGKCVMKADVRAGTTYLYDLRSDPGFVIDKPFHSLQFYLPRSVLDGVVKESRTRPVGDLACQFGFGHDDKIMRHIGAALLEGLNRPTEANQLFIDHMMLAFTAHIAQAYGGLQSVTGSVRGGLAPWQLKRACEKLDFRSRRDSFAAAGCSRVRSLGQLFFARVSYLHRPAAAPMAAAPAREGGHAVDERAGPAAVRNCDRRRICQPKPLYESVFGAGRR